MAMILRCDKLKDIPRNWRVIDAECLHMCLLADCTVIVQRYQGWIGYAGTHVPMFVHKLGLIKPRQTRLCPKICAFLMKI